MLVKCTLKIQEANKYCPLQGFYLKTQKEYKSRWQTQPSQPKAKHYATCKMQLNFPYSPDLTHIFLENKRTRQNRQSLKNHRQFPVLHHEFHLWELVTPLQWKFIQNPWLFLVTFGGICYLGITSRHSLFFANRKLPLLAKQRRPRTMEQKGDEPFIFWFCCFLFPVNFWRFFQAKALRSSLVNSAMKIIGV